MPVASGFAAPFYTFPVVVEPLLASRARHKTSSHQMVHQVDKVMR